MSDNKNTRKLVFAAIFLATALVLPFLTGQIPQIGSMLSPMHIPALICGFVCGWPWGLVVGAVAPLLRSVTFGMPPMFVAIPMAFELAAYGACAGMLYKKMAKTTANLYIALISSMVFGRVVWGVVKFAMAGLGSTEFSFAMFLSGAVTTAIPGIILHIAIIPPIVKLISKAGYDLNN